MTKRISRFLVAFVLLFGFFIVTTRVLAEDAKVSLSVSFRDNCADYGKVQYSLDNGTIWHDITHNISEMNATITEGNFRLKLVPNENYSVDYAGIELRLGETNYTNLSSYGFETEEGYAVPTDVETVGLFMVEFREGGGAPGGGPGQGGNANTHFNIHLESTEWEFDNDWSSEATDFAVGINSSNLRNISKEEVNYITQGEDIVGLDTKDSLGYTYDYDNSGHVTFFVKVQWNDVITSLKINDVPYNVPHSKADLEAAFSTNFRALLFEIPNVPYADTYNIEASGRKQTQEELIMGNFGWTYDANTNEYSDDDKILNGVLDFVKAEYKGVTYTNLEDLNSAGPLFEWNDGVRGTSDPTGEAMFPAGTVLTLRLTPDSGYQLTSFDLNGFPFEPGEEIGLYTFTIGGGNWHLGAHFTEVSDEVQANSSNVKAGNISLNKSETGGFSNGTAKLEVNDVVSMSPERKDSFENTASENGYDINNYLDISLYNSIYKAGLKDSNGNYESWDTEVNNLGENATITLQLEQDMNGKDIALVHEKHSGDTIIGYEVVNVDYDKNNNAIVFDADSFSNYAVMVKDNNVEDANYTVPDSNGNTIVFSQEAGHEFTLNIVDYLSYTKEEVISMAGITSEEYDAVFNGIKESVKKDGELVGLMEIEVLNEQGFAVHKGPFEIKLKITDAMKGYNTFKLIFVNDDFTLGESTTLTKKGDYFVGTLQHLSTYALVGSNTEEENSTVINDTNSTVVNNNTNKPASNPQTSDTIYTWFIALGASILGFIAVGFMANRLRKTN